MNRLPLRAIWCVGVMMLAAIVLLLVIPTVPALSTLAHALEATR